MTTTFPSLIIKKDALEPKGPFAEAQAEYLDPDPDAVSALTQLLQKKNIGIVAHFYMDPQLQGVLSQSDWPHIQISDSLAMADRAIRMADAGVKTIIVLGVDFMSENVRAMLDASNHEDVLVYRVAEEAIGCSLAESAEAESYGAWLTKASQVPASLHVVYINTSLLTKAQSHHLVPTITCTSSNVVRTVLSAAAQIPGVNVWYGPDTYMGRNLEALFKGLAKMSVEEVQKVHPDHTPETIQAFLPRFHYFRQGVCVVHHMFGDDVARRVRRDHEDAFVTAHLEVPGEMFELGLERQREGRGVVGSTSNILDFITRKVNDPESKGRLSFVLGTEAGMITSIVRSAQKALRARTDALEIEIIFPVAGEAIAEVDDPELRIVPGIQSGEGCPTAGGCATCPYMKMNSLDALMNVVERVQIAPGASLLPLRPRQYEQLIGGRTAAEVGGEPILHMRAFQEQGKISAELITDVTTRTPEAQRPTR